MASGGRVVTTYSAGRVISRCYLSNPPVYYVGAFAVFPGGFKAVTYSVTNWVRTPYPSNLFNIPCESVSIRANE